MTDCAEDISTASVSLLDLTSSSSISDKVCVHWGCELSASQTMTVFEAEDDLLENQFFVKTICLSAEAGDEMHVVGVSDAVGGTRPVPIATLRHCMPMVSFSGLELMPPVTFKLCSGNGPVFISAQHIALNPTEIMEEEEDEESFRNDILSPNGTSSPSPGHQCE
ncbi:nucleoplasmin-2a [Brachyhypopomus gauderio]|uniref:nucleoplasmin-2a n=1 Tax=Brachyhypopomus gauderio TaxID=698409 RepID=UPI004042E7A6